MTKIVTKFAVVAVLALAVVAGASSAEAAFTRDLTIGSQGADVVELQTILEAQGYLVMPAGVAKGYFGALTKNAVAKWQAAAGISPAAGYFGPISRAAIAASGSTGGSTGSTGGSTGGSSSNLGSGEASLEQFDFSSGDDDDVEEGSSAEIAEIEFDVEDGDVRVNRIDLQLVADNGNDEKDPWDTFDSLRLLADGKEIGEIDLSDEDEYLDEDDGTFRLSNLNYVVREGETAKIVVEIEAQNNVDGADEDKASWTINVLDDGIRATDGEGIEQYVGSDSDTVDFDVVVEGDGEELNVSTSKEDPDAQTFKIEDDAKSDWYDIFAFDIEAEESDIEIDSVTIDLVTSAAANKMIDDLILEIDGDEFDDWSFNGSGSSTATSTTFDIDGDFTLDEGDEVTVVLKAKFKAANVSGQYSATTTNTIEASIADEGIEAEGADDILSDGTASGEEHTLATAGIVVPKSGFSDKGSLSNNDENTSRDYTFSFEVTAFEEDFYVATSSITVFVEGPAGALATSSFTVDSTGDEDTDGVFTVEEGKTETFTVTVTISEVSTSGQYRVGLDSVDYTEDSDGVSDTVTKDVTNSDFRTAYRTVNQ